MKINISPDLSLPRDTVTSTLVGYGGKGMGKTNFGSVLVEELSKNHLKWSVLDPLGVWWGVRHSGDGKGPGIECVVLGGAHGDMPIEPTGGAVVADLVVDEPGDVVVDFSRKPSGEMWTIGEKIRFVTDYTKRVFQRQGGLLNGHRREPFMQILDEAARYVPQIIPHGSNELAACLSAWETLVEEGRNIGIGVALLTQRSARMAKSVSEVADAMFSFRIIGPNSIKAVTDWLGEHVPKQRVHEHIETLRSLERGNCLVVSPGWLQFEGVIHIRARETFDSSATPKPGERPARVTGKAAKPDLDKYAERMKETIERAQANDPKKLQAKIRELELELRKKQPQARVQTVTDNAAVGRAVADAKREYNQAMAKSQASQRALIAQGRYLVKELSRSARELARLETHAAEAFNIEVQKFELPKVTAPQPARAATVLYQPRPAMHPSITESTGNGTDLAVGERACLTAAAQYPEGVDRSQLTILTAYKRSSRDAYLSRLKKKGFIDDRGGKIIATPEGIAALGSFEPLPVGPDLQKYWLDRLPQGEKAIFEVMLKHGTNPVDRDYLTQETEYLRSSRDAYLSRMMAKKIVEQAGSGLVKLADFLF